MKEKEITLQYAPFLNFSIECDNKECGNRITVNDSCYWVKEGMEQAQYFCSKECFNNFLK